MTHIELLDPKEEREYKEGQKRSKSVKNQIRGARMAKDRGTGSTREQGSRKKRDQDRAWTTGKRAEGTGTGTGKIAQPALKLIRTESTEAAKKSRTQSSIKKKRRQEKTSDQLLLLLLEKLIRY